MRPPREIPSSQQKKSRWPSIDQKRGKAGDSSGIRAEHIENCDRETKEWTRQIFNEIVQQEDLHTTNMAKNSNKGDPQKTVTWKMLVIIARCARYRYYTNFSRQHCMLDWLRNWTNATRPRWFPAITSNCRPLDGVQDAGAALPRMGCTTVHLDARLHEGPWTSLEHYGIGPLYIGLLKRLYSQQEGSVMTDKESTVFQIKKRHETG